MSDYPKILVIDDDKRYYEPLIDRALNEYNLELVVYENLEEAESELEANSDLYEAIIIDGLGKLTKDSKDEDPQHLKRALEILDIMKGRGNDIARFINTAYYESLIPWFGNEIIFSKNKDEEKLFGEVKKSIASSLKRKIRSKYPEPFQCFGKNYLDKKYEQLLINVISISEDCDIKDSEDLLFNPCRIILEQVFRKINEIDERTLPYEVLNFENQKIKLSGCVNYLYGINKGYPLQKKKLIRVHIYQQIQTVIGICHASSHEIQEYSKYTFQSVLLALFDVLIWLKFFVDSKKSDK